MTSIFTATELSKRFGGVQAVVEASLSLRQGVVSGLLGPNGAGKSTLVDLLSGQQRSDSGEIVLDGRRLTSQPAYHFARLGVARTFQTSRLTNNLTVSQALQGVACSSRHVSAWGYILGARRTRKLYGDVKRDVISALQAVDLHKAARNYVRDLGWEQQRRLEIARALAMDCRVLLLDEPTAGMHAGSLPGFSALIRSIADRGVAVLLIEHNVAFMRATADELYAMDAGQMLLNGRVADVLSDSRVVSSYLGTARQ